MLLQGFINSFVLPLVAGGDVLIGRPLRPRDRDMMVSQMRGQAAPELAFARLRRAQTLTPHPPLPEPDEDELSLWIGLYNTLVFDHPDRPRVWARGSTWRRVEGATRSLLSLPAPEDIGTGLARNVSVDAFLELVRVDTVLNTAAGEVRMLGQAPPRRRLGFSVAAGGGGRSESVQWLETRHAPETQRLIEDVLRASPLTCMLHPLRAPPGWSPLHAADYLQHRGLARSICHAWAQHKDWTSVGGAVMSALLPSVPTRLTDDEQQRALQAVDDRERLGQPLALPGAVVPSSPAAVAAVVAALIHLHFVKVLELDARLGIALGSRDPGILSFLALPLLLPSLGGVTGTPLSGVLAASSSVGTETFEGSAHRRFGEYVDHLADLVPRAIVENLLAGLVPAIVQTH